MFNGSALSDRSRDNNAACGSTQGGPVLPNALGGMDVPDDDVFGIGSTRRGSLFHIFFTWGYMCDPYESPLVTEAFDWLRKRRARAAM